MTDQGDFYDFSITKLVGKSEDSVDGKLCIICHNFVKIIVLDVDLGYS